MGNIKSTSNSYKFVDSNLNCPATPMMKQYFSIKQDYKDCLLFYRMGDFYELFFDDAKEAAAILDIALTKRGKHLGDEIPMCGVPAHSHETYLNKLIKSGYRVAICEQTEDPKKTKLRGYKAIVKREVTRIITPGTITEDSLLSPRKNNYLMAIGESEKKTFKNKRLHINLALNYGSKYELVQSLKTIIKNKKTINEKNISKNLFTKNVPDPDLLIRTGNTQRLSNFLLWQLAYSEIFFEKKLWPDFSENDYNRILNKFRKIKRNFGKI